MAAHSEGGAGEQAHAVSPAGRIRVVTSSDLEDVKEMAAHTYGGHDWILPEFPKWMSSSLSLTLGAEIDGHVRSLENLRVVDEGTTGWLEALRVHPDVRRQGQAGRLQREIMAAGKRRFPGLKRFRYTTAKFNQASLNLAGSCGLAEKHRWGFVFSCAAALSSDVDSPKESSADSVYVALLSTGEYAAKLRAEYQRLVAEASEASAIATFEIEAPIVPCGVQDVIAIEASREDVSSTAACGLLFDWKVDRLDENVLSQLCSAGARLSLLRCGGRSSYAIAKTRPDFEGTIRVFNIITDESKDDLQARYMDFIRLAIHECDAAAQDGAESVMFFYELAFQERLLAAGLASLEKECILLEGTC